MTTIKEIAIQLKITPTAVSYALNGRTGKVSPATRQRVLDAAQAMGYQPHTAAQALRTGRHHSVLVLIRTPQLPYYAEILHHMVQQVLAHPYQVIIQRGSLIEDEGKPPQGAPQPATALSALHTGVDGYFIVDAPQTAAALRTREASRMRPKPVISMGTYHDNGEDFVGISLGMRTCEAVRHLLHLGCHRIAYLIDAGTYSISEARRAAYVSTLEEAGLEPQFLIASEQSRTAAYHFVREHVLKKGHPDALLCINDEMAMGASRSFWDLGLRVPGDVSLIGCDGIPEAEYAYPSLTTIVQPIEEMCRIAWEFLERRLEQPTLPPQQRVLEATLSLRESSRSASGEREPVEFPSLRNRTQSIPSR